MRLLLVEDNAMNGELFVEALESDGHEVVVERDGRAGLARARAEDFDIVFLDVHLPEIMGDQVCRELKAAGYRAPIVALTAAVMPEDVERSAEAGFDAHLGKPISPASLREIVRRYGTRAPA